MSSKAKLLLVVVVGGRSKHRLNSFVIQRVVNTRLGIPRRFGVKSGERFCIHRIRVTSTRPGTPGHLGGGI